jgi:SAM-dependent methyltransferase
MWNERYAGDGFAYGTEPNAFLAQHAKLLIGPVLSLAEGEGRNAVFLASLGLDVLGVDGSEVGLRKARTLAAARGVSIRTEVADLATYEPPEQAFGAVVSISAHLPSALRKRLHRLAERALRPGGIVLLEAYTRAQLARTTGGPKDPDMLMSREELLAEFRNCEPLVAREIERDVVEGRFHTGLASVVQFLAQRRRVIRS